MKLSILVPVHNEGATLDRALRRILDVGYPCPVEVVVVDDGSTDDSPQIIKALAAEPPGPPSPSPAPAPSPSPVHAPSPSPAPAPSPSPAPILQKFGGTSARSAGGGGPQLVTERHPVNRGKGAAIRTAASLATGDLMTICDADLEYDPADIPRLVQPALAGEAEVVFGTRTFGSHTSYSYWYVLGNRGVTTFANIAFNCYLSDLETCFKLMPLRLYRELDVRSDGFGMEAEVTGKLLRRGIRPFEVPISYRARTRAEGKKLTWRDGVEALWILTRIRLRGR